VKALPGYKIIRRIDKGGMTELYVARDPDQDTVVVRSIQERFLADRKVKKFFKTGIEVLEKLDHPNVIDMYDSGRHKGLDYMVVEFHEALNLREWIKKKDDRLLEYPIHLLTQLATALNYIHDEGFLHMDLKPENILIREDLHLILIDFDLAIKNKNKQQKLKEVAGTPTYLAPETLRLGLADERSEIYVFGACAYELLAWTKPFSASDPKAYARIVADTSTQANPLSDHLEGVPAKLDRVIMKCLAKNPDGRYPSMSLVLRDLLAIT